MSTQTLAWYAVVFGGWLLLIFREGGIGIGIRFLYGLNVTLFFLLGPMLGEIFGSSDRRFLLPTYETAVQTSLYALLAYLIGSYLAYPAFTGKSRMIPVHFGRRMADPARLDAQWKVAWALIAIGFASLPLYWVIQTIPTVRAVGSKLPWAIDTGLVMLSLYVAYSQRFHMMVGILFVLAVKGLLFTAMTGHAGSIFFTGMFLICLALLAVKFRISTLAVLTGIAVIAFFPAKMWLMGRAQLRKAIEQETSFEERIGITLNIFFNPETSPEGERDLVYWYRNRGDFTDLLAAALAHTPTKEPYASGATYMDAFIAVVPRFIWADKPYKSGGNQFVTKYTGIKFDEKTSIGTNYLFEMYVNFGVSGVVLGMFVLGLLLGWLESFFYQKAQDNLFYEYCLLLCSWFVCLACDRLAELAMTIPPAVALCLLLHIVIRSQFSSRYLPRFRLVPEAPLGHSSLGHRPNRWSLPQPKVQA